MAGNKPNINRTTKLPRQQKGGPVLLVDRELANLIISVIEAVLNAQIIVPITDGTNILPSQKAKIVIGDKGLVITMPPTADVNGLTSGGGTYRVYKGSGAPTSSTLAAQNYLASPNPDLYVDTTAQTLYFCFTAGTESTSVWKTIVNTPAYGFYDNSLAWPKGSIVQVQSTDSIGTVTLTPGTYVAILDVGSSGTGNDVPQYPYPAGTISWMQIALGPQVANICSGGDGTIYVNASAGF